MKSMEQYEPGFPRQHSPTRLERHSYDPLGAFSLQPVSNACRYHALRDHGATAHHLTQASIRESHHLALTAKQPDRMSMATASGSRPGVAYWSCDGSRGRAK